MNPLDRQIGWKVRVQYKEARRSAYEMTEGGMSQRPNDAIGEVPRANRETVLRLVDAYLVDLNETLIEPYIEANGDRETASAVALMNGSDNPVRPFGHFLLLAEDRELITGEEMARFANAADARQFGPQAA